MGTGGSSWLLSQIQGLGRQGERAYLRTSNAPVPTLERSCRVDCCPSTSYVQILSFTHHSSVPTCRKVIMIHMRHVKREELNTQLIRKMAPPLGSPLHLSLYFPQRSFFPITQSPSSPPNQKSNGSLSEISICSCKSDPRSSRTKCEYSSASITIRRISRSKNWIS